MPAVNGVGEPCAGKPHARFEAAGTGNGADLAKDTGVAQPTGKPAATKAPGPKDSEPPRQSPTLQDQTASLTRQDAARKVGRYIPGYDKKISFAELQGRTGKAVWRARKMESNAMERGKVTDNPTSGVWRLVEKLCEDSKVDITSL